MNTESLTYKKAIRKDYLETTDWISISCSTNSKCCTYKTQHTFTYKDYIYRCPQYRGVDEEGVLCAIPLSIDFIMSNY